MMPVTTDVGTFGRLGRAAAHMMAWAMKLFLWTILRTNPGCTNPILVMHFHRASGRARFQVIEGDRLMQPPQLPHPPPGMYQ
jgi:hypothetical protein